MNRRVSQKELDLLALGKLPADQAASVRAAIAADPALAARWAEEQDAYQTFRTQVKPKTLDAVEARLGKRTRSPALKWFSSLVPITAVFVISLFVWPEQKSVLDAAGLAAKGQPAVVAIAKRGETVFPVEPKTRLRAGDAVRFVVQPVNYQHVLVAAVDEAGVTSIYVPYDGTSSLAVRGKTELPGSVILDDTPGRERVFAFFSKDPLSADSVRDELKQLGAEVFAAEASKVSQRPNVSVVALMLQKEKK